MAGVQAHLYEASKNWKTLSPAKKEASVLAHNMHARHAVNQFSTFKLLLSLIVWDDNIRTNLDNLFICSE